jgi:hypothetical protein
MPIRSVREIEAQRAARAHSELCSQPRADPQALVTREGGSLAPDMSPADEIRGTVLSRLDAGGGSPPVKRKRGHAEKSENGKWLPTGSTGFAAPPVEHRFQKGNKGGGRKRKVSPSADDILRKHLDQKRKVRIDGRERMIETRELLVISTIKAALAGDRAASKYMLGEFSRLAPPPAPTDTVHSQGDLNASDALSLSEYREELLAELRANAELSGDDSGEADDDAVS